MKKIYLLCLLVGSLLANETDDTMAKMRAEFEQMKQSQANEFDDYKAKLDKEYSEYKQELSEYWDNPKLSTKKKWMSYSEDKKSRSEVDFEKGTYTVEVIAKNIEEAKVKLKKRVAYVVSKNTKEVVATDPLQKKNSKTSTCKRCSNFKCRCKTYFK